MKSELLPCPKCGSGVGQPKDIPKHFPKGEIQLAICCYCAEILCDVNGQWEILRTADYLRMPTIHIVAINEAFQAINALVVKKEKAGEGDRSLSV